MAFVVVYDASVLYPSTLRDLLIRISQAGLVQAKWTNQILDEVFTNLHRNRPDLDPAALARTRQLMLRAVRDCLVLGYEPLIEGLKLPDLDDRHVLAAAIKARAQVIVTATSATSLATASQNGTSTPNIPTSSSSTRSISIARPSTVPSNASPTPGAIHPEPWTTFSAGSTATAWSNRSPPSEPSSVRELW